MRRASSRGIFTAVLLAAASLTACQQQSGNGSANVSNSDTAAVPATKNTDGYAVVDDVRVAYRVFGDLASGKVPLVVLHGSFMSGEDMAPLVKDFVSASRPVITIDARGHGRTGDVRGPLTYPQMADDTAAVLHALKIAKADVLGYSMGGTTAIHFGVRHPEMVDKLVILSGAFDRSGYPPEVLATFSQWKPDMFKGTPIETSYRKTSATPDALPGLVDKMRALETSNYDVSQAALRAIPGKTMIVFGDADGLTLAHALALFKARGGDNLQAAETGMMTEAPRARIAVLPATTHIGMMSSAPLIAQLVSPFLDDTPPAPPSGFFTGGEKPEPAKGEAK